MHTRDGPAALDCQGPVSPPPSKSEADREGGFSHCPKATLGGAPGCSARGGTFRAAGACLFLPEVSNLSGTFLFKFTI